MIRGKRTGNNNGLASKEERRSDNVKTREFTKPCIEL
jgi:hypothetical protein